MCVHVCEYECGCVYGVVHLEVAGWGEVEATLSAGHQHSHTSLQLAHKIQGVLLCPPPILLSEI